VEKKYYRHRGGAVPDPSLCGPAITRREVKAIRMWMLGLERASWIQRTETFSAYTMREMDYVARVKRRWRNK
jgi:hypothetical protein